MTDMLRNKTMRQLLGEAQSRAARMAHKWGAHPTPEFTGCRIAEEAGEFVKAATSRSEERPRRAAMEDEAVDVLAMMIRMFREWPNGIDVDEPPLSTRGARVCDSCGRRTWELAGAWCRAGEDATPNCGGVIVERL